MIPSIRYGRVAVDLYRSSIGTCSGVICSLGVFRLRDIKDGTSCTYLAGEKYVCPDAYFNGVDSGTDQCWDEGLRRRRKPRYELGLGTAGWGPGPMDWSGPYWPPMQDQPGVIGRRDYSYIFGSAHPNSFNMVFCDGSVQAIPYTIDPAIHDYLGRQKRRPHVDVEKLY